jgi:DNA-damage-inducible protein J
MSDDVIRSRIDPDIKAKATELFKTMGLTISEAIRLFVYQSVAEKRIPFSINIPNAKTKAILTKANHGQQVEKTTLEQLSHDWDEACGK